MRAPRFFLVLATLLLGTLGAVAAPRPNVLIVLVDDAGYGDYACHGQPFLKTPNVDRLHDESVRFTDFHVAPMCTPTRGQLMTGQDCLRNGACSVTAGRALIRPGVPTMAELLGRAGYKTGIFGKWHLGDNYPNRPMEKGFQTAEWVKGWGFTSAPEYNNNLFNGRYYEGGETKHFPGYVTDFFFDEAMKWMQARGEKQEPFFCYLPLHAVHAPWIVAQKYAEPFQEIAKGAARYFGMLANVDENMGRLESFLQKTKLKENTIVIFMNDNGGTGGVKFFNAGLRGHKTEYYDGGHVSPCFVRWPAGGLRSPGEVGAPAQIQDLLPTLLEFCGAPPPSLHVDGISLTGVLKGSAEIPDRILVVQYGASPEDTAAPTKWNAAVVWNQWRLVHGTELYDMQADRAEAHDVAAEHAEIVAKLRAHYEQWWRQIEPGLSEFVPISLGAEQENPVLLSSSDWQDQYVDNSGHINSAAGPAQGGAWNVMVEKAGDYEVVLRRWPFDMDVPLTGVPEKVVGPNQPVSDKPTKAVPVAHAKLAVAGGDYEASSSGADAREIRFAVKLPSGRTQLHGWFQDAAGQDLCGSYFARVTRH